MRCTTKLVTNCDTSAGKLASHSVAMPLGETEGRGRGTATPNEVNQLRSGCSVRKTTAQNIHFVNPPPIANVIVAARRRLTPASTSDSIAADGAGSSSAETTSSCKCEVVMRPHPHTRTYLAAQNRNAGHS